MVRVVVPRVPGVASPIAGVLRAPAGVSVPAAKVFTPSVLRNGKASRVVIPPVVLRAVPAEAPTAPRGAKVIALGEPIQQSQPAEPIETVQPVQPIEPVIIKDVIEPPQEV